MITRRFLLSLAVPAAALYAQTKPLEFDIKWVNPPAKTPRGVMHKTLMAKAMGVEVGFNVYLPPNYEIGRAHV